jgi:X-Pro dipeptidyl-peptidase C-terminal non-catalytic domain
MPRARARHRCPGTTVRARPVRRATVVSVGWLLSSHRSIDETRSTATEIVHDHSRPVPLAPGATRAAAVQPHPVRAPVPAGHRLQLELGSNPDRLAAPASDGYATRPVTGKRRRGLSGRPDRRLMFYRRLISREPLDRQFIDQLVDAFTTRPTSRSATATSPSIATSQRSTARRNTAAVPGKSPPAAIAVPPPPMVGRPSPTQFSGRPTALRRGWPPWGGPGVA